LLVFAVLYTFGLQHHVGAGALSDFFQLIRLHTHVGVSPSALQTQLSRMEALLPLFQQQCEASVPTRTRQAVVAADETFFGEILILVLMDLSSGYLLLESIQKDRGFDTWFAQVTPRLEALGIEVNHAISDRAKALIKLAVTGFECTSGADTFHEQYGLSRWLSPALGRRKAKADQCCELAQKALDQPSRGASTEEKAALAAQQACAWEARAQVEQAQQEYQKQLLGIAEEIHPFSLEENTRTTAESVVAGLETRAQALETLAAQQGIQDTRSALKKFRAQIGALSSHVSFWWLWVEEILLGWSLDEATRQWLTSKLLPVLYWHYQMRKTQNRVHRKRYQEAWQRALEAWKADPFHSGFSESELQRWLEWGEWMVRQFHRSSSAVEGRNGRLSQLYHNGRGLTKCRLAALTVIHNYGVRRSDGTIAAERLFSTSFPDLFDWLLNQMGELPLPRKSRHRVVHNPLKLEIVPA
jgi:phage baseplate assembly protein W